MSIAVLQFSSKSSKGSVEARLGSPDRDAEGFCHRREFEVVAEAQNQQDLILRVQPGNQAAHFVARRQRVLAVWDRGRLLVVERHEAAVASSAVVVDRSRHRQSPKPTTPQVGVAERRKPPPGPNKRFLGRILRVGLAVKDS
jgi:hypothetical protein